MKAIRWLLLLKTQAPPAFILHRTAATYSTEHLRWTRFSLHIALKK